MSYGDPRYGYRGGNGNGPGPEIGLAVRMIPILIGLAVIGMTMVRGCQQGPFGRMQIVGMNPEQSRNSDFRRFMKRLATPM